MGDPSESSPTARRRLLLVGEEVAAVHDLPESGRVVVGRAEGADILVEDPSISRRHAVVHVADEVTIEDTGSFNGTRVAGHAIESGQPHTLIPGDPVEMGMVISVLIDAEAEVGPADSQPRWEGSGAMRRLRDMIKPVGRTGLNVVIVGEAGVGKAHLASRLHLSSSQSLRPFVTLDAATVTVDELAEGLGLDNGGTVFLKNAEQLPREVQRPLHELVVSRTGHPLETTSESTRFVASFNTDPRPLIEQDKLDEGLFLGFNGITVAVPPLRERMEELPDLVSELLLSAATKSRLPESPGVSEAAILSLNAYRWPGNLRELRNVIERAVALCDGEVIEPAHLFPD